MSSSSLGASPSPAENPTSSDIGSTSGRPPRISLGVRHMLLSAFYFSVMSLLVRAASRLPSHELVLARATVCLILSYLWLRSAGVSPWGNHRPALLLRGLFGTIALLCFYYALVTLPLAEGVVLLYTSPIFTAALAAVLLDEPVTGRLLAAIACCAAGVLAIARPAILFGGGDDVSTLGVAVGFIGAMFSAGVSVLIRRVRGRDDPLVIVFYFPLVAVPVSLPFAIATWVWPTPIEWLMMLGFGVATQLAQIHMTRGLMLLPAGRATAIGYTQVVLVAIWGAIFFDEIPDALTLGGAGLILVGVLTIALTGVRGRAAGPAAPSG